MAPDEYFDDSLTMPATPEAISDEIAQEFDQALAVPASREAYAREAQQELARRAHEEERARLAREEALTGERAFRDGELPLIVENVQQVHDSLFGTVDEAQEITPDAFQGYTTYASVGSPPAEPELDMTEARSRQTDLVDSTIFDERITVIGAGAIGSFVVLTLAKMGFKHIAVYDNDIVNVENISNQFYPYSAVHSSKVNSLLDMIRDFERLSITPYNMLWNNTVRLNGYVIMAVDTMAVRNQIYRFIKRNADVFGFIDGRMGGQQAEVYSVDLTQAKHKEIYEKYLWSDSEASELPCTQKAVMYNVLWIASQIANNLRLMLEQKPFPTVMQMDFENVTHINVVNA